MRSPLLSERPWDSVAYQRIVSAAHCRGEVIVEFADGSEARVAPRLLVAPRAQEPDWPNVWHEEFHIVVPSPFGEIEVPWDVIRVHSDPLYDAFLAELMPDPVAGR